MASVLVLACARGTFAVGLPTVKESTLSDVEENYWERPPSLSKTSWREGEEPAKVDLGKPYRGSSCVSYSNRLDATVALVVEMPTKKGEYTALFTVAETEEHTGLVEPVDFSISASAEIGRGYYSVYDYASQCVLTIGDSVGEETLVDFPMYVRLKNNSPTGFKYTDLKRGKDELRFFDTTGRSLDYEVTKWDERGESTLWVRVPLAYRGATIMMCWNLRDGCELPDRTKNEAVWSNYVGVWHMDETIRAAEAATNLSYDATGHGLDLVPKCGTQGNLNVMTNIVAGKFGNARVIDVKEQVEVVEGVKTNKVIRAAGNYLEMPCKDDLLELGGVFTLSFWVKVDDCQLWPKLFSRRTGTDDDGATGCQGEIKQKGTTGVTAWNQLLVRGDGKNGCSLKATTSTFMNSGFMHMAFSYDGPKVSVYVDGVSKVTEAAIATASDNGLPLALGNKVAGTDQSLWGKFDEVRLIKGAKSAAWAAAEYAQGAAGFYTAGPVTNDATAVLKNSWTTLPTAAKTTWDVREGLPTRADFDLGETYKSQGTQRLTFYDRATGEMLGEDVPTKPGDYRAVVSVAELDGWGALEYTMDFRIVVSQATHALGVNYDRVLLMNDDYSIEGGEVADQNYDAEDENLGLPYWRHLDENGEEASTTGADYWSDSLLFNLGGGSHHVYYDAQTNRLWDLRDIRVGNTFNNGEILEEITGKREMWDEGLAANQNYLGWNPLSQRVVDGWDQTVGAWHRYAGQVVMQNTLDAAVTSRCYTNGLGTIYFDAVNGWTDNITNEYGEANYRLIVEIATNALDSTDAPTDERVDSVSGGRLIRAAEYADWQQVPMRVLRFDGADCEDLGTMDSLALNIEDGGSYECFYRVIVPVKTYAPGRFRVRRTAIDPAQQYNPDGFAYILLDNLICSSPTLCASLTPYGRFDPTKSGKRTLGYEGAFVPAFPAMQDTAVRGRGKIQMSDGSPYSGTGVSSATMHYRWHYIEQQTTDWLLADLDLKTMVSARTLDLPPFQGDIDFWFELNQNSSYYSYADYSGRTDGAGKPLGLGATGYTEEIASVTNRATGADWFVRTREGRSPYAEARVFVKTSASAAVQEVDMMVSDNRSWRGFYRMTSAPKDGILWRIELRDRQDDGETTWIASTNCLYVKDWTETLPELPAAARLSSGTTNDWSRMPCDMLTGFLTFQFDEQTYGVTVVHSDYQDFNSWNDAGNGYFTGSSAETNTMSGTSSDVRTYDEKYATYSDEPATNDNWSAIFSGTIDQSQYAPGYQTFLSKRFSRWDLGKGMWVHEYYQDSASRVGYQMAGGGEGYMDFKDTTQLGTAGWPRGIESVSFNARIAQAVAPESAAYVDGGEKLTNYTFMTRTCFDLNKSQNFAGDASLSLFAYYRPRKGTYEARWEQIKGVEEDNPYYKGVMTGPARRGQRLVISRWNRGDMGFVETRLYTVTNSASFKKTATATVATGLDMPYMPYNNSAATNNLMPFYISVSEYGPGTNLIVAAVRLAAETENKDNKGGVDWNESLSKMADKWYVAFAFDTSADRLRSGAFGVLSSNCEGLFLTPQFREGATYASDADPSAMAKIKGLKGLYSARSLNSVDGFMSCYADLADGWWEMDPGRERSIFGSSASLSPYGFEYAVLDQTVDLYTKKIENGSPTGDWTKMWSVLIDGFGKPGRVSGYTLTENYPYDVAVRLQTGGGLDDNSADVVIADVTMRQWRGRDNWSTSERDWDWEKDKRKTANDFGTTNVVFTCGWVTDGAVRLSAKRTRVAEVSDNAVACSVRSPLFDGAQYGNHGEGLGKLSIRYREPTRNIKLNVQIITNYTSASANLAAKSRVYEDGNGNGTWHTIASIGYDELWGSNSSLAADGTKSWSMSLGLHGAKGMMRLVVDNDLVRNVANKTNPSEFGEIDIVEAMFKDEPSLSKSCWWGWNLQTIGDAGDTQHRMYLPDCASDLQGAGQSLALNNSVVDDINPTEEPDKFKKHLPFLQSPTFTNGVVGQLSFKARKYDLSDRSPLAKIVVYGADEHLSAEDWGRDDMWTYVAEFLVSNTIYTTYNYKTDSQKFKALRLAVVDVEGTENPPKKPKYGGAPQRVMIDEVMVSEAVRAMLSFRNVGAFRTHLNDDLEVPGAATADEQPLCGENWGVQAEVFAAMLESEIDPTVAPKVKLHWYVGKDKWGYENWKSVPEGTTDAKGARIRGSAYLAQTVGSNYVYRSSYKTAPDAVLPAQSVANTVVQYMLEVEYQVVNAATGHTSPATNWLDAASWATPSWYAPIDYNEDPEYGAGQQFSAYTILDKIAPGWAWINEVNVYGVKGDMGKNTDKEFQYVELCVPAEADLTGWQLRLLEYKSKTLVVTNWVAKFGSSPFDTAPGQKRGNMGLDQGKVFRLIGNKESEKLNKANGTLDGVWSFGTVTTDFRKDNGLYYIHYMDVPFGVQLLRPSGIIESSVVAIGTNETGSTWLSYDPAYVAGELNRLVPGSKFFWAAEDYCGEGRSSSVTSGRGESAEVWANDWACSPGYVNTNFTGDVQQIDPHPTPIGDSIVVYASVDTKFGRISQFVGGEGSKATNASEMIILQRGGPGTNILYRVDPWFELKSVTTNDVSAWSYVPSVREQSVLIGAGASNNLTVVASAQVDSQLRKYGLTDDNPYTPAVMDWLVKGETMNPNFEHKGFRNPGEIALAEYRSMNDVIVTNLTLTQMYWFDMDPTVGNLVLKGGFSTLPYPVWRGTFENVKMSIFMMISNKVDHTAWSPYVLRGLDPNYTSWDYDNAGVIAQSWTSETFKVTGILANGLTSRYNVNNWIPLRWFVFHEDSFYQPSDEPAHPRFTTDIEIIDPHTIESQGAAAGWYDWFQEHGRDSANVLYWWWIDDRRKPVAPEVLKKENFYKQD